MASTNVWLTVAGGGRAHRREAPDSRGGGRSGSHGAGGPRPPAGVAEPESSRSYRAFGADSRAAPPRGGRRRRWLCARTGGAIAARRGEVVLEGGRLRGTNGADDRSGRRPRREGGPLDAAGSTNGGAAHPVGRSRRSPGPLGQARRVPPTSAGVDVTPRLSDPRGRVRTRLRRA